MKKLILFILLMIGMISVRGQNPFPNPQNYAGNGTANEPFKINIATDLDNLRYYVGSTWRGAYFEMTDNIDLSNYIYGKYGNDGWLPIGSETNPFMGNFNGKFYEIEGLRINRPNTDNVGLFSVIECDGSWKSGLVEHLIIKGNCDNPIEINGNDNVGALAGKIKGVGDNMNIFAVSVITSLDVLENDYCTSVEGNVNVGGLVGYSDEGVIFLSSSHNAVIGEKNVGGLVGYQNFGTIHWGYAMGWIIGNKNDLYHYSHPYAGGLIGRGNCSIYECYAACNVINFQYSISDINGVGALIGYPDTYHEANPSGYDGFSFYHVGLSCPVIPGTPAAGAGNSTNTGVGLWSGQMKQSVEYRSRGWRFNAMFSNNNYYNHMGNLSGSNWSPIRNFPRNWNIVEGVTTPYFDHEAPFLDEIIEYYTLLEQISCAYQFPAPANPYKPDENLLGIDGLNESKDLKICPNPTTGEIFIDADNQEIKVFDSQGRLLIETKENKIDLSFYPAGVYVLNVNGKIEKVIKQ